MSRLSDLWHGIRRGFDINKMRRDPLGSASKIALIYGLGSTAVGAISPDFAQRAGNWLRSGFGFYPNVQGPPQMPLEFGKPMSAERFKSLYPQGLPGMQQGFLERIVKGTGSFLAKPFDLGADINSWIKGGTSWSDIKSKHFGWVNTRNVGEAASIMMGNRGQGGGRGGGVPHKHVGHRNFQNLVPQTSAANISAARQATPYKQGGLSQALITGSITPENLAMLGYGSGQVTGAGGETVSLDDVAAIKTTLRSAIG
jgi:hypothetical protein